MKRLAFLYPPCGAEDELYTYGEALDQTLRVSVVGVRSYGGDEEHALRHLRRTADIANLAFSSGIVARLRPSSVVWACTSGSFVGGYEYALRQTEEISRITRCPASSTSLAFINAAKQLSIRRVAILASYPEEASEAFRGMLASAGLQLVGAVSLSMPSAMESASWSVERIVGDAKSMRVEGAEGLMIPDTAVPAWQAIEPLESALDIPVLTANQVTVWEGARLAGVSVKRGDMGRLFAA